MTRFVLLSLLLVAIVAESYRFTSIYYLNYSDFDLDSRVLGHLEPHYHPFLNRSDIFISNDDAYLRNRRSGNDSMWEQLEKAQDDSYTMICVMLLMMTALFIVMRDCNVD
ncbi:unnamed protein product [Bursaphelenchus okinawaensis]|uniref:Uncharacterized protein n=1 Tax=Bursaphelenchus okinawaensis TaxID=465554 RepID=A0A811LVE8_9BILA|nr:unnamed protein product [Bursaphelenchus okinawaensis]CAG9128272.1 unnamed protein product [Bursaphelenchus okinawaensis]